MSQAPAMIHKTQVTYSNARRGTLTSEVLFIHFLVYFRCFDPVNIFSDNEIINVRGDLSDTSAKKATLTPTRLMPNPNSHA